jgi:multidrug efflux pump subunit AcrA (membrane-fusion protein)
LRVKRNAITVVAAGDHIARVRRIAQALEQAADELAGVLIDVQICTRLEDARGDRPIIVLGDPDRDAVANVAFVARAAIPDDQLQALIVSIATGSAQAPPPTPASPQSKDEARRARVAFAASRKLAAATDLPSTETFAVQAVCEMLDVERVHCLFFDAEDASLWSEVKLRAAGDDRQAITGMVGWTARTGLPCAAEIAGDDPRYHAAVDDPEGNPAAGILVQPILGADARVHAVLVALRRPRRAPLGATEAALLERFAEHAAPLLDQLSIHVEGQQLLENTVTAGQAYDDGLFREEAVAAQNFQQWGDIVRVTPRWLAWAYWLLVVLIAGSIAFVSLGRINTYSTGTAVIRSMARTSISARVAGNVSTVTAAPGDRVTPGTTIARLDDVDQRSAVDHVEHELETQLRNHMLDPSDATADTSVRTLRLQLEQARSALDERAIHATTAGVVSDLRVRPGQHVEPGDIAASIVDGNSGLEAVALLPGEDRPQLAPGMTLRLELAGWRYAYQFLTIDSVSSDVIAPTEARRVLGAEVADSLHLSGPVVVVRGRLNGSQFTVDGRTFTYHDGMLGTAEVAVRSERIIVTLVPSLRRL